MMILEDQFIRLAAHLYISEEDKVQLKSLSEQAIDWEYLAEKARNHSVVPFIYSALKKNELLGFLPSTLRAAFQHSFLISAALNQYFIDEVEAIPSFMPNEKVVLLKGSALNLDFYPNKGMRSMSDIDFLVKKDRKEIVRNAMLEGAWLSDEVFGYRSSNHQEIAERKSKTMFPIYKGKHERFVDIHWKFFNGENDDLIAAQAIESAVLIKDNLYRLSNEMMLVHLCSNFAKDFIVGVRLRSLCDIREILDAWEINWDIVASICSQSKQLEKAVSLALNCVKWMLGSAIPASYVIQSIQDSPAYIDELLRRKRSDKEINKEISGFFSFNNPMKNIAFVYRTVFPQQKWLKAVYPKSNFPRIHYWTYLFSRYVLKKNVRYQDLRKISRAEIQEAHSIRSGK